MTTTIETLHTDMMDLKKDLGFIKKVLSEELVLTDEAVKALKEARETLESDYVDLE